MIAGTRTSVATGHSTEMPDFDFETYSEAGYVWNEAAQKWDSIVNSAPHGLGAVGASVYTEHPSCEVLSLAYNLKQGAGPKLWLPGMPPPQDLFDHINAGGLLEAWNSMFEYLVWKNVCAARMGWPPLHLTQLRDAMAKSRAFSAPGALGNAAKVLRAPVQKMKEGQRLIRKFCVPRKPTKKDPRRRIHPSEDPVDGPLFGEYNLGDIASESAVSAMLPDLSNEELNLWLWDQTINSRGVSIDTAGMIHGQLVIAQAQLKYSAELKQITGGAVQAASELPSMKNWLAERNYHMNSMDADHIEEALKNPVLPPDIRRVLEIRASLGSASVKKLGAIARRVSRDGRLRDLFAFAGADRTGRWAGRGPQPQNLPNSGPDLWQCKSCDRCHHAGHSVCPHCGANVAMFGEALPEWCIEAVECVLQTIKIPSLDRVEFVYGDATALISGCLRGLFSAADGHDLICSDYSAIEAVVLACMSGEQWRIDVFNDHGKIYEMSASKITGIPFEEMMEHKRTTGEHHPTRKKIGKVSELASGYQGGLGAWKAFGADKFMDDGEIKANVKAWRNESPAIVDFWYGLERAAVAAISSPGSTYDFRGLTFGVVDDKLFVQLLSGRKLTYHEPRLHDDATPWGKPVKKITYMGWNSDYKKGPTGWMRLDTYGGKLTENIVQATARDIMAHAIVALENSGYPVVLHVHDEVVTEVPAGVGSVEEVETIMATLPAWCADWPIRASGGWRGKRYRK